MRNYAQEFFDFTPTTYLDCAYHGPFPRATVERIQQAIDLKRNPARLKVYHYFNLPESVRKRLASIVGADPSEIALTNSATQGIGIVATGLGLKAGDEVVVAAGNFPSNLFTWIHLRRLGLRVHVLRPSRGYVIPEDVESVLSPRTRVLALDWVSNTTGVRIDLARLGELAHRHDAFLIVDGTQGAGAVELNLHSLPVDALVAAAYKWLLGPYGTGFVYLSPRIQDRLDLQMVNWLTVEDSEDFDALPMDQFTLPPTARVFDVPATANFLNLSGLDASLEFIQRAGVRTVAKHCERLLSQLAEGVRRLGLRLSAAAEPEHRSTILCFQADSLDKTTSLAEKLSANEIAVSLRRGMIRVSPYLYNSQGDIDRLLQTVR